MSITRRFAAAAAIATVATLGVSAPASASVSSITGADDHHSVADVSENNVGPVQACNNTVPTNVLGVQVPVSEIAGIVGFDQQGNSAASAETCEQESMQDN